MNESAAPRDGLALLEAVYFEVDAEATSRRNGQVRRKLFPRVEEAELVCVAESLGPRTQLLTGIPWVLPTGELSDKGRVLDRDLLAHVGYTADPWNTDLKHAYLTDVSHLWLGRDARGKLRRPSRPDKDHCAPWLEREIAAVDPKVVLLLGRHAAPFFLARFGDVKVSRLSDVIAQPFDCVIGTTTVIAVPTLHPTGAQMARGGSAAAYRATVDAVRSLLGPR